MSVQLPFSSEKSDVDDDVTLLGTDERLLDACAGAGVAAAHLRDFRSAG